MPIPANESLRSDNEIIMDAVMILSAKFWETHNENELFEIPKLTLDEAKKIILDEANKIIQEYYDNLIKNEIGLA